MGALGAMSAARAGPGNPTEFALLGLLAERPQSGYDLKAEVEARLGHFWSESYGHLYPMLKRLQARKLVAATTERRAPGRPARRVYAITEAGRHALEEWFREPPAAARPRNELLLRIFLGRHAPAGTLRRDVAASRERALQALQQLRALETAVSAEGDSDDARYWKLVIGYGVTVFSAIERWAAATDRELRDD